ncbi:MAG TPA: DUF1186 domain-containing protein [Longimicrobiaceae bacterium]|nr:DUF1186 domain-containing protein [Longimicrobiaceae bacterium]
MDASYPPPVDQFLTLGRPSETSREWPDYLALGLGEEHVPELIRMLRDEELMWAASESPEVWAPLHAWRALGQLRAEAAIEPLLDFLDGLEDEDWAFDELPTVFGMIGPAALPALVRYLADPEHGLWNRVAAIRGLEEIAKAHEEAREEVVAALTKQLEKWYRHDEVLNASLIDVLVELRAVEAAPLMEQAFEADRVDIMLRGDWEDVQVDLGLIPERTTTRPRWHLPRRLAPTAATPARGHNRTDRRKNRKKLERQSRKRNRRRR